MNKNKIYIIAEIGINHDGSLKKALKLIDYAKIAGASAVKFQMFKPDSLSRKNDGIKSKFFKKKKPLTKYEFWSKLRIKDEWLKQIKLRCKKNKIDLGFSIFDEESLLKVFKLNPNFIKIASSDLNDTYLIEQVIKTKKKIIISTGMSNFTEIKNTSRILKRCNYTLLHCVSLYPTPYNKINLNRMIKLKKFTENIGFSDHTLGTFACIKAIEMGATTLEKHFTLNKNMDGPDHLSSADISDLKYICDYAKLRNVIKGTGKINPTYEENLVKKKARKSIWAKKNIHKNEKFSLQNIEKSRPGLGMNVSNFKEMLGKKSSKNYKKGDLILEKLFAI